MKRSTAALILPLVWALVLISLTVACSCAATDTTVTNSRPSSSTAPSSTSTNAMAVQPPTTTGAGSTTGTTQVSSPYFSDISSSPYKTAIESLAEAGVIGVMDGSEDGTFRPLDSVLRAEFARMIVLGLGLPVTEGGTALSFEDVERPKDNLYPDDYVAVAAANGLVRGYPDGNFRPYADITRAQLLTIMVRACQKLVPSPIQEPPADWIGFLPASDPPHGPNIARAEYSGLLAGIDLETFAIDGKVTRGEIAQIIWNLRNR